MQIDMHYYATFALARSAGLKWDYAWAIATAAQYVDDSDKVNAHLSDGTPLEIQPTAHHPVDIHNILPINQRLTWIPFHFLPGGKGETNAEKLVCDIDSKLAEDMVSHNLSQAKEDYGMMLIGITAHVYADTFSHYGFSGLSAIENQITPDSINLISENTKVESIRARLDVFFEKYCEAGLADNIRLGHGGVATYPDQPYLTWQFSYAQNGILSPVRENQKTFLAACKALHRLFSDYADIFNGEYSEPGIRKEFDEIELEVVDILALVGSADLRIERWQKSVREGKLFANPSGAAIPTYNPSQFANDAKAMSTVPVDVSKKTLVILFLKAAEIHRSYVLNELLPKNGISVDQTYPQLVLDILRKIL
jgi:hypothetical protein